MSATTNTMNQAGAHCPGLYEPGRQSKPRPSSPSRQSVPVLASSTNHSSPSQIVPIPIDEPCYTKTGPVTPDLSTSRSYSNRPMPTYHTNSFPVVTYRHALSSLFAPTCHFKSHRTDPTFQSPASQARTTGRPKAFPTTTNPADMPTQTKTTPPNPGKRNVM